MCRHFLTMLCSQVSAICFEWNTSVYLFWNCHVCTSLSCGCWIGAELRAQRMRPLPEAVSVAVSGLARAVFTCAATHYHTYKLFILCYLSYSDRLVTLTARTLYDDMQCLLSPVISSGTLQNSLSIKMAFLSRGTVHPLSHV